MNQAPVSPDVKVLSLQETKKELTDSADGELPNIVLSIRRYPANHATAFHNDPAKLLLLRDWRQSATNRSALVGTQASAHASSKLFNE